MQTHSSVRGYSDFFASGFRAVTTRPPSLGNSRNSLEPITNGGAQPRRSFAGIGISQRRPRPVSMFVPSTTKPTITTPEPEQQREKKASSSSRSRRLSFVSFSSRLFERMTSSSNDENFISSPSSKRSSRSFRFFHGSSDESLPEVWITTGGPHTPSAPNGSAALHQSIDPFNSSPDTRSMFIDLSTSPDNSPSGTPKRESFLSLTGTGGTSPSPSSNRSRPSSLQLFTRRERPTSIHTMPLPSRSRRSSFSLHYRSPSQEKSSSDFFLIVEEEPANFHLAGEPILENEHEEWDAPAKIDWRQFHIDILTDEGQ